ncbi:hypothetical protein AKJ16_DCAP25050 [Drosera capensis]
MDKRICDIQNQEKKPALIKRGKQKLQSADSAPLEPPFSSAQPSSPATLLSEPPIAIPLAHRRSFAASDDVRSSSVTATLSDPAISSGDANQ